MTSTGITTGVTKLQRITEDTLALARKFRQNMTPAERIFWNSCRGKKIAGLKFRRQQIIDGFYADFYCEQLKLCIEIDGGIHEQPDQMNIDLHRAAVFKMRGINTIRFTNETILNDLQGAIDTIAGVFKSKMGMI